MLLCRMAEGGEASGVTWSQDLADDSLGSIWGRHSGIICPQEDSHKGGVVPIAALKDIVQDEADPASVVAPES
jgi:hypothetical protein